MEKLKIRTHKPLLPQTLEMGFRMRKITELTNSGATIVPVAEYFIDGSFKEGTEIKKDDIVARGVTFEAGHSDTMLRILVRPDVSKNVLTAALFNMILAIKGHVGIDWTAELAEAIAMVAAQLELNNVGE